MPEFEPPSPHELQRPQEAALHPWNSRFQRLLDGTGHAGEFFKERGEISWKDAEDRCRAHLMEQMGAIPGFREKSLILADALDEEVLTVGGDEHLLYFDEGGYVLKLTYGNNFGLKLAVYPEMEALHEPEVIPTGNLDPRYYLKRWILLNSCFMPVTRLEGILPPEAAQGERLPRLVISQMLLPPDNPLDCEIHRRFRALGFIHISEHAYYRPKDNVLLGDAAPRNVRIVNDRIVPFDAVAEQPMGEARAHCMRKAAKYEK